MMKLSIALARILTAGVLLVIAGTAAAQQAYPNKPIRLISPNPPGGGTTILGRIIGQKLTESWGQPVLLDNRAGGYGIIGGETLLKSPPDGYTLMIMTSTHIITPLLMPAPYDPIKDFAPVATLTGAENVLVVHPSVPANTLQEFIALGKSKPGQLNYATAGSGSGPHLSGELLGIMTGIKMQHIPYKGSGPAVTDLIGGQVQLMFVVPTAVMPFIKSGRLKAIAITGRTRAPALPNVPTFTEAGLPGFDVIGGWYGILAPAGTPKVITDKLSTELAKILAMPDTREKIVAQGMEPLISTSERRSSTVS